jgi:hypothetical protein
MAMFNESGNRLTLETISAFEVENEVVFTKLYKDFLLDNNGGYPDKRRFRISDSQGDSSITVFFGIGDMYDNLEDYIDIFEGRIPECFIPIAIDPNGNIICLGTGNELYENIYFWDHEQENDGADMSNMYFLAKDIYEFVENLK